jgi:GNAT superfamily N-acetyltransferase
MMSEMVIECISADLTRSIRHQVLWQHKPSLDVCVLDTDNVIDAFHLGVRFESELISVGSFFPQTHHHFYQDNVYRLRAMATLPNFHGRGSGRALIEFALQLLRERNANLLWCDARLSAVGFYQRLGFSVDDEIYEVPLIGPHKLMWIVP